jgi:hypothetical protein
VIKTGLGNKLDRIELHLHACMHADGPRQEPPAWPSGRPWSRTEHACRPPEADRERERGIGEEFACECSCLVQQRGCGSRGTHTPSHLPKSSVPSPRFTWPHLLRSHPVTPPLLRRAPNPPETCRFYFLNHAVQRLPRLCGFYT